MIGHAELNWVCCIDMQCPPYTEHPLHMFRIVTSSPQDGVTALHIATFKGHKDIVKYLCVNQRLAVNIQDNVNSCSHVHIIMMLRCAHHIEWDHSFDVRCQARTLRVSEDIV